MQVTLLGTRGWMPGDARETTCFACRDGDSLIILDAGTGLRRLLEPTHAGLFDGVSTIHLLLTHFHLDHTCGLAYLPAVFTGRKVVVHAAAAEITGVQPEAAVAGLLRKPYNPRNWDELTDYSLKPLVAGANDIAGHRVMVRPQQHTDVSVAYRIDDAVALATDTVTDPGTAEFSAGVGLLLHEAWYNAGDPRTDQEPAALRAGFAAHSEVSDVARLAAQADVGRLVLMHLNPLHDESYYAALGAAGRAVFARTEVRADGAVIDTSDPFAASGGDQ
jgi:ribonuclease BN (tRNA processing enzyme)